MFKTLHVHKLLPMQVEERRVNGGEPLTTAYGNPKN